MTFGAGLCRRTDGPCTDTKHVGKAATFRLQPRLPSTDQAAQPYFLSSQWLPREMTKKVRGTRRRKRSSKGITIASQQSCLGAMADTRYPFAAKTGASGLIRAKRLPNEAFDA